MSPGPVGERLPAFDRLALDRRMVAEVGKWMDTRWPVLGGVGLDTIVGLIPVVGDLATTGIGMWMLAVARRWKMPRWRIVRMAGRLGIDLAVGTVPFAGDVLDLFFRAHRRNARELVEWLDSAALRRMIYDGEV